VPERFLLCAPTLLERTYGSSSLGSQTIGSLGGVEQANELVFEKPAVALEGLHFVLEAREFLGNSDRAVVEARFVACDAVAQVFDFALNTTLLAPRGGSLGLGGGEDATGLREFLVTLETAFGIGEGCTQGGSLGIESLERNELEHLAHRG